jgi:hypothetical protein
MEAIKILRLTLKGCALLTSKVDANDVKIVKHYNNKGLFCDPNIIANNKERSFRKPVVANHNSSQTLKLLRYHNIRTHTIATPELDTIAKLFRLQLLLSIVCD